MRRIRSILWSAVADVASVVVFVAIGRRNHDEDAGISGIFGTAAPFLIALVVAWVACRVWRAPLDARRGLQIWVITVALGMVLRNLVFDDGTATAFVIVATVFLGIEFTGWRAVVRRRLSGG